MQSLTFSNSFGTVEIGNTSPIFLQKVRGVSGLTSVINRSKSAFQDGSSFKSSLANDRIITLEVFFKACDYDELNLMKRNFQQIFNPKVESTIKYNNQTYEKEILGCYCQESPTFSQDEKSKYHQTMIVSIICIIPCHVWC